MHDLAIQEPTTERPFGPELSLVDNQVRSCICGAQPLIISTNGGFYFECPPCRVRSHTVAQTKTARTLWNGMISTLRRYS